MTTGQYGNHQQPSTCKQQQSQLQFVPITTSPNNAGLHQIIDLSNYSALSKVLGVTAYQEQTQPRNWATHSSRATHSQDELGQRLPATGLPEMRMRDVVLLTVTGVDFTGALYVQMNGAESKVYICLFTCATRAVHLEIVADLSTETFPLTLDLQVASHCHGLLSRIMVLHTSRRQRS